MPATRAEAAQVPNKDKFEKSISSKPFVFVIGEERKEFHIHKELIGQLSPVLNALVNGNMKEAREGRVEWLDLDVDTFVRFAKFAYSGDYTPAEPELLASDDALVLMPTPEEQDGKALTGESSEEEEEEESLQDDESVGSSGGSNAGEPIELSSDLEDDDPGDPDQDTSEYSSPSETSSTLDSDRARFLKWRPIDLSIDEYGVMHSRTSLPYSIENYMIEWEKCLNYRRLKQNMPLHKRRRYDTELLLGQRPPDPVNKKYQAMHMFFAPIRPPNQGFSITNSTNENPHESYLPVFLSHARLYILADKYGIERLRRLALGRLHQTLIQYVVHKARIADLVALAQEIFDNTMEFDNARTLIVDYFVCFIEDMQESPELQEALIRGGEFPAMLVSKMAFRRM
ncbi:hypothetical protein BHE90_002643 [Fusarium euwallaceae]|uniref:BTB domain-containing protein n=1 Tax=Fusarium euwallaceae TaxID=1147111 RepID=A0A430M471_9HYPO|nr:hypothetical protein BHE90_002643 [Fusarium euwallaceae]